MAAVQLGDGHMQATGHPDQRRAAGLGTAIRVVVSAATGLLTSAIFSFSVGSLLFRNLVESYGLSCDGFGAVAASLPLGLLVGGVFAGIVVGKVAKKRYVKAAISPGLYLPLMVLPAAVRIAIEEGSILVVPVFMLLCVVMFCLSWLGVCFGRFLCTRVFNVV
jgi:hypothetical protein